MGFILGIDPGLSGGLAFYNGTELFVYATPVVSVNFVKNGKKAKRNEMDLGQICDLIRSYTPGTAYIEQVNARPGQGVTGMFRFGQNFGQYEGVLAALDISVTKVTPQQWKKIYDLGSEKTASLELARNLFPNNLDSFKLKKHDGLAEASLIAKYGHSLLE